MEKTDTMPTTAFQLDGIMLPGAAELVWGSLVFVGLGALLLAGAFLVARAAARRSARDAVDHWRERALRAEAQLELLEQQRDDA